MTFVEVLKKHKDDTDNDTAYLCSCNWHSWSTPHENHLAEELANAGFGLKADAWDEGAETATDHYAAHTHDPNGNGPADPPSNPYRKFKHGKWVLA